MINHVVAPGTVRFTCSFLRKDLSRRGRIVPLYRESLRRLAEGGVERATFLIDGKGRIARSWRKVKIPGHVDDVLAAVKTLKKS